jgi:hypothetical protein
MKIYWSYKSVPELAELDKKQVGHVWRQSLFKAMRHWQTWVGILLCGCFAGLGIWLGASITGNDSDWFVYLGGGIGAGVGGFVANQIIIPYMRPYIRENIQNIQSEHIKLSSE